MYDICHPIYYHMSQLGCNDQVKLTTAFYVYIELCEVKRYWNVDYKYCESLQLMYLVARKTKNSVLDTFIPWPAIKSITLDFISEIKNALEQEKFTFVFKEGDTTSVYYSISAGIHKPAPPEKSQIFKEKIEKKFKLEKEINRNTSNLYERALAINDDENIDSEKSLKKSEDDLEFFTALDVSGSPKQAELSESERSLEFTKSNLKNIEIEINSEKEKLMSNNSHSLTTNGSKDS